MKKVLAFLGLVTIVLTSPYRANAAGETGHSDLMRLLSSIYGLNIEVSDFLATVNQSVDKVPLSAATQSGRASSKLHFGAVVTQSDLDEKDLKKLLENRGKRPLTTVLGMFFKNTTLAGGIPSLANAESAEMLGKAMRNGDGVAFAMGMHYLLDVAAPFHDGYKGALDIPIPVLNKLPFFHQIPFGHLADGTSPDRLSIGKVVLAMEALGPFLITLRESQKQAVGVNTKWLNTLKSQGVDINDNESIMKWFLNQDYVAKILQENLPANKSELYVKTVTEDLKTELNRLQFFNDQKYMEEKLNEIVIRAQNYRNASETDWTINKLIYEFIDQAWQDGKLNEKQVIKETTTDYLDYDGKTEKLSDLIINRDYAGFPEYAIEAVRSALAEKKTHHPHTREWLVDQIAAKITDGMINQAWVKFNTAYLNQNVENSQIKVEGEAIGKIEKHFFNKTGKYSYNPGTEYWIKVFKTWSSIPKEIRGHTVLQRVITFCDLIISTKIYEGFEVHSPQGLLKAKIFFKTMAYIFSEEFRNPITTKGNLGVLVRRIREKMVAQLKAEYPEGLITEEMIKKSKSYNKYINAKYNSDQAVGAVQKTALGIKKSAEFVQNLVNKSAKSATIKCRQYFLK